jgi:hypothetical protein
MELMTALRIFEASWKSCKDEAGRRISKGTLLGVGIGIIVGIVICVSF